MMGQKHLHELLREDQEPFHLKNFIADRRCPPKSTITATDGKTALQPRKRKPIIESTPSTNARNFCINHVCLFSFQGSPDVRKSPFLDFPSPAIKSPNNANVFLHIPARTAAMLLDAAMRIQKQSRPKPELPKNAGSGLFGSFFKRLTGRSTGTKRCDIGSVRRSRKKEVENDVVSDLETSCSSSPSSPFHFSLQKSPSPGRWTPDFLSPATSPSRHLQEEGENYEAENCKDHVEEEEEKEQCSPVSVLDLPFEDDNEEEHGGGAVEVDGYDIECSFASVQKAKHQLLQKLQRFERLAELNPIELEKQMSEQWDNEDNDEGNDEDDIVEHEVINEALLKQIFNHLGVVKTPTHMKRLVTDLIVEENKNEAEAEHLVLVKRVCRRMDWWKMVESNTIDMMVELDFRREKREGWRRYDEEKIREIGMEMEVAIFGVLVEELAQELVTFTGN